MRVAVGSANPVKRRATEDALAPVADAVVESVDVDSGVSEQPTGHAETRRGAEIRAGRALAAGATASSGGRDPSSAAGGGRDVGSAAACDDGDAGSATDADACDATAADARYDLGVGVEGGVAEYDAAEGLYLIMWAAVTDGERVGRGAGPSLRLPEDVAARVRAGEELGPVMDDAFGLEDVAENEGAAGVLTGRAIDRRSALAHAVAGALGPFVTDCYG